MRVQNSFRSDKKIKTDHITVMAAVVALHDHPSPPTDLNGDGLYEVLNGNGVKDLNDVERCYKNIIWFAPNEPVAYFDFNANGEFDVNDIVQL